MLQSAPNLERFTVDAFYFKDNDFISKGFTHAKLGYLDFNSLPDFFRNLTSFPSLKLCSLSLDITSERRLSRMRGFMRGLASGSPNLKELTVYIWPSSAIEDMDAFRHLSNIEVLGLCSSEGRNDAFLLNSRDNVVCYDPQIRKVSWC